MPLQKTNLGSSTMRCPENTEQIHRKPMPKYDPNITPPLKSHFSTETTPQTSYF